MIEVSNLVKRYGSHTAVSGISFTIEPGHIYGFLGPNGAGKSTTMNIMTGCLAATEGTVTIDGHDIVGEPAAAKKNIGYLPEQPPLYFDMTTEEYLRFVAEAKGLKGAAANAQVASVMERTSLTDHSTRLIKNLSKGYKQRVGIAQAILGEPQVVILDEPTVGLDPAQMLEIRELIQELGRERTVILSSHILSEVSAVCDHIIIISRGRLVASAPTADILAMFKGDVHMDITFLGDANSTLNAVTAVEGVENAEISENDNGETALTLVHDSDLDLREAISRAITGCGSTILQMTSGSASLEDVFMELTAAENEDDDFDDDEDEYEDEAAVEEETPDENEQETEAEEE